MIDTPNKNYLSNDVVIKGSIKFANEFIFDGNLEGDITSADGIQALDHWITRGSRVTRSS